MSPVIRSNWLLLALALLLAALIHLRQERALQSYMPITRVDIQQVQQVTIHHGAQLFAQLQRSPQGWQDLSRNTPVMDEERLQRILHITQLPSLHHFSAAGKPLSDFGLNPPRYTLQLDEQRILFGSIDPASGLRYVMAGGQIHLVSDGYTHHLAGNNPL